MDVSEETPSAETVQIRASWDGAQWTVRDVKRSVGVTSRRPSTAQRSLAAQLPKVLSVDRDQILFDVVYEADHPAMLEWAEAASLKVRAEVLLHEVRRRRVDAIRELMSEGMTPPEIAAVFGVSYPRILQILAYAKGRMVDPELREEDI
jgi:hypothetical protein